MTRRRWNTSGVTKSYSSLPNLSETNLRIFQVPPWDPPNSQVRHLDIAKSVMCPRTFLLTSSSDHFAKFGAGHRHGNPSPENDSTWRALNYGTLFGWIASPSAIICILPLRDDAPRAIYLEMAQRGGYTLACCGRCTGDTWSRAIATIRFRQM